MSKQANPTLIGGFVLGAVALLVIALLVFGGGEFFTQKHRWVLFFEGSVNGLDLGAPVKLRGVTIGKVIDVRAVYSREKRDLWIPVVIENEEDRIDEMEGDRFLTDDERAEEVQWLVKEGLRGQLVTQSYITGKLFIQIDFFPGTEPRFIGTDMGYPELPTIPSASEKLMGKFRDLQHKLSELPLEELVSRASATLEGSRRLFNDPAVKDLAHNANQAVLNLNNVVSKLDNSIDGLLVELNQTLQDTRHLLNHVDRQVDPLASGGVQTLASTRETLEVTQAALSNVEKMTAKDSPLYHDISSALRELAAAARSIRNMTDYLERNPNAIIYGKDAKRGR